VPPTARCARRTSSPAPVVRRAAFADAVTAEAFGDLNAKLLNAAARATADSRSGPNPFEGGLLVQMLALRRPPATQHVIESFERLVAGDLQRDADIDRGAAAVRQTRFLRSFAYETPGGTGCRRAQLRAQLLRTAPARPMRHVIVTVGDRSMDPAGLWPADFDLLTQLPLLEQVDIVATRGTIAAGLFDRLQKLMPGFEEGRLPEDPEGLADPADDGDFAGSPALITARDGRAFTVSRDREDELAAVAGSVKRAGASLGAALDRQAVVFKRPLPYVYLARDVFADAGIPYQTFDAAAGRGTVAAASISSSSSSRPSSPASR
jgi:hypothetical protein